MRAGQDAGHVTVRSVRSSDDGVVCTRGGDDQFICAHDDDDIVRVSSAATTMDRQCRVCVCGDNKTMLYVRDHDGAMPGKICGGDDAVRASVMSCGCPQQ